MQFAPWNLLFTGMVSAILLLNVVWWFIYRERIYGLYTLAWLVYFSLRIDEINDCVSANTVYFMRATAPMLAYVMYFDFANALIHLRTRLPVLLRLLRLTKIAIVVATIKVGQT